MDSINDRPLVSIILPCYNVESFLGRCISCLLKQTYTNFEAIFIDDCSSDNTWNILSDYTSKYPSIIKILRTETNSGSGIARDEGLKIAKGEYVMFVDSDDYIHPETIEICVREMQNNDIDFVEFNYKRTSESLQDFEPVKGYDIKFYDDPITIEKLSDHIFWNKCYKKSLIDSNNIRCKYRLFQDTQFTRRYAYNCKRAAFIDANLYYYYINQNSITSSYSINKILSMFERSDELAEIHKKYNSTFQLSEYYEVSRKLLLRRLLSVKGEEFLPCPENSPLAQYCKKDIRIYNKGKLLFKLYCCKELGVKFAIKLILGL